MLKGLNSAVTVHIVFDSCLRSSSFDRNPQLAVLLFNTCQFCYMYSQSNASRQMHIS